jgi:hypothetical protein
MTRTRSQLQHDAIWATLALIVSLTAGLLFGLAVVAAVALIEDYGL